MKRAEIDVWLHDNHRVATVREASIACGVSNETINRRERVLGIFCVRHVLKRESPAKVVQSDVCKAILRMRWAPPFDYVEDANAV